MELSFENELDLENRVIASDYSPGSAEVENLLRPHQFLEYTGQQRTEENLAMFMEVTKQRKETLDHVLLYSPPGLGKTTLAGIIMSEMGAGVYITSGPAVGEPGDSTAVLTNLSPDDVLLTSEIHRLSRNVEEILYPMMEGFTLDTIAGKGRTTVSYHLSLLPFTLVGTAACAGQLSAPLRNRFDIVLRLGLYSPGELAQIITRGIRILDIPIEPEGTPELASRSCGTPCAVNRLLCRVYGLTRMISDRTITARAARRTFEKPEVDEVGLDTNDRRILHTMTEYCQGGPVELDTLAAAIEEESAMLEDAYEPYLVQIGFLGRAPRGRCVTRPAYLHLGLAPLEGPMGAQQELFQRGTVTKI